MSLTQIFTRAQLGIDAPEVCVEVHIAGGLPAFTVVGLPETAVREARDRVRSAILNSGFEFPLRRITVNLSPADLPKEGGRYDLPIALGILGASQQVRLDGLDCHACFGELALSGECRPVTGLLPALIESRRQGQTAIVPSKNWPEACLIRDLPVRLADSLAQVCASQNGGEALPTRAAAPARSDDRPTVDLADVYGQHRARRALEVAAAGAHHLLMMGPPGTGKSMLAERLPTLLPPLSEDEAMCCASIRSVCGWPIDPAGWRRRPFRSPHHTVSAVALVGGGATPRPGEISLAHHGVLFLDEFTEFQRAAIEVLREPLETGRIHIARAAARAEFPARFQLVAAMNPCPGGCDSIRRCDCSAEQLRRYRDKLSAPLLDRIDIRIELPRLNRREMLQVREEDHRETSARVRARVVAAREQQMLRQQEFNAWLDNRQIERHCRIDASLEGLLANAIDKLRLSARSYHKILRLSRTLADLDGSRDIAEAHLAEAISYRRDG